MIIMESKCVNPSNCITIQLQRPKDTFGFGFSVCGGHGTDLPPIVSDIHRDSPAAHCGQLESGDVILSINDKDVAQLTLKEVLKCLRLSGDVITLKVKKDPLIRKRFANDLKRDDTKKISSQSPNGHSNSLVSHSAINNNSRNYHNYHNNRSYKSASALQTQSNVSRFENHSPPPLITPKFEAYMMTGDLMINLANRKSSEPFNLNSRYNRFGYRTTKNAFQTPTVNSMPSSPVGDVIDCAGERSENGSMPKQEHKQTQTLRQMSAPVVRYSKSEDHLLTSDSVTVVDIDCVGDCISNSLDTLLNDDGAKVSSSSSSSPDNDHLFNDDEEPFITSSHRYSISENSSNSSSSNNSSTKSSSTNTPDATLSSANVSPTKTMTTATTTQAEQTESSMSENYSIVSSLTGAGYNNTGYHKQNSQKVHNQHTLSLSSSIETSSSTPSSSPDDFLKAPNVEDDGGSSTLEEVSYEELKENTPVHVPIPVAPLSQNQKYNSNTIQAQASFSSDEESSDIESLNSFHYSPPKSIDTPSATRLAKRLFNLEGFKKSDVSRHLSKNNEFSRVVAEEYLKFFDFTGDTLDVALRNFLSRFCLIGETQERERVLVHFSKRFLDSNPNSFRSNDATHTLTCALMLLNTDLHGETISRRMTCGEFIENLVHLNDGDNFPRETLRQLFQSIKMSPLEWAEDDDNECIQNDGTRPVPLNNTNLNQQISTIGHNPFLEVPNPNCATEYKKGYIMRKSCYDSNGKRTPFGKRGWKMFYATLRDLVLYLHKDEHGFRKNQLYESLNNSIRIHHSLASKATDYIKKQFVFRLETADMAEYLFQTSDAHELQAWIDTINLISASLSSPPFPGAVGSNSKKFQRPLLPVTHTRLNLRSQLEDHENRISQLESELENSFGSAPEKSAPKRVLNEKAERETFLQYELKRYKTYVSVLKEKIAQYAPIHNQHSINTPMMTPLQQPLIDVAIGEESSDDTSDTAPPIITVKRCYSAADRFSYNQTSFNSSIFHKKS